MKRRQAKRILKAMAAGRADRYTQGQIGRALRTVRRDFMLGRNVPFWTIFHAPLSHSAATAGRAFEALGEAFRSVAKAMEDAARSFVRGVATWKLEVEDG